MTMKKLKTFRELFESVRQTLSYRVECLVLNFTDQILSRMQHLQLSRSGMAEKFGSSPAYVTKVLSGGTNFTLESMVKVADALDCDVEVHLTPRDSALEWIQVMRGSGLGRCPDYRLMSHWRRINQADEASALIGAQQSDPDAEFDELMWNS